MDSKDIKTMADAEEKHWWYSERRYLLKKFIENFEITGNAADVGAAGGGNTQVILDMGLNAIAVEPDDVGVKFCIEKGIKVIKASANSLPLSDESQDLVVLMDVLEHLKDDTKALIEIRRILKPNGYLFITIPMHMKLWSKHDLKAMHYRRYEKQQVINMLELSNYSVISFSFWNVIFYPIVRMRRNRVECDEIAYPGNFLNRLLKVGIMLERYLPLKKLTGVSGIVVAQAV
jgi:SAM-dependent methyltransferase